MKTKDYITSALSIVAMVVSIISLYVSVIQKNYEIQQTLRSQLSRIMTALDSVFDEDNKLPIEGTGSDDESIRNRRSSLNGRKRFLARQSILLMKEIHRLVTDFEYNAVADAFCHIGEFDQANIYYEKAIGLSERPYYKSIIIRAYAGCLFNQKNFQDGRKYYQKSISLVPLDSDPHIYHVAETYERWAKSEAAWSFPKEAEELFEKAKYVHNRHYRE